MSFDGSSDSQEQEMLESTAEEDPTLPSEMAYLSTNDVEEVTRTWSIGEDLRTDLMALVVLDDMPHETLNEILRANEESVDRCLWLADTHDTIPDHDPAQDRPQGTVDPIDSNWRSPLIGSSVEAAAAFIRAASRPPKALSQSFFAVLQREQYEEQKQLLIYKILDDGSSNDGNLKLQSVPCPSHLASYFFRFYDKRQFWDPAVEEQGLYYGHGAYWPDDQMFTDHYALIVLDDVPVKWIDDLLAEAIEDQADTFLWLADTYDSLTDYEPGDRRGNQSYPMDEGWKSPFAGKSIEDAANFIRNTPKPPKPLCKTLFAVMEKELYEQYGHLKVCKIFPKGGEVDQSWNEEHGTKCFREAGRSLLCKIASDKNLTQGEGKGQIVDEGEFEVQWIELPAKEVESFFIGFERWNWFEYA